jgi:hypothetical protein
MTSQTNSRYGLMFAGAIAMTAAIAVTGSSWAKSNGQQSAMTSETAKFDVSALPGADIVLYIEEPF